jgi:acetyl-CoA carboxylase carboxyl transferase subunit beta
VERPARRRARYRARSHSPRPRARNRADRDSAGDDSAGDGTAISDSAGGDSAGDDAAVSDSADGDTADGDSARGGSARGDGAADRHSVDGGAADRHSVDGGSAGGDSADGDSAREPAMTGPATAERQSWVRCGSCLTLLYRKRLHRNLDVCPECGDHRRLTAVDRIAQLTDPGSFAAFADPVPAVDPLGFVDLVPYRERLADARAATGLTEAVLCGEAAIDGHRLVLAVMDFRFLGGSLGSVTGELIVRAADRARQSGLPFVVVTASGGARMQEGALSLMQMAATIQAIDALRSAGLLTVSVVTDPTYGGVAASFATATDVIVAESGARMGFAGPRVIQQTLRQTLPAGFQTADFLFRHGYVDMVVERRQLRPALRSLLATVAADLADGRAVEVAGLRRGSHHDVPATPAPAPRPAAAPARTAALDATAPSRTAPLNAAVPLRAAPLDAAAPSRTAPLNAVVPPSAAVPARAAPPDRGGTAAVGEAIRIVRAARQPDRPTTLDYLASAFDGFVELHGDRLGADCSAVVAGLARLDGRAVAVIGHQKGHTTAELVARDFGMASPAGYRKAVRVMRLAARLGLPVVTLIDTPGASPGVRAEEQGQALAIAESISTMAGLPVPAVAVITGEGGSGGALALAVADRVLMLHDAVYSVISPEGCAAILWNDPAAAPRAAAALRLTAPDLLRLGVIDAIVGGPAEPGSPTEPGDSAEPGSPTEPGAPAEPGGPPASPNLRAALSGALAPLLGVPAEELVALRRARFRRFCAAGDTVRTELGSVHEYSGV